MAWEKDLFTLSFPVDADSSTYQFHAMSLNSDKELIIGTATTVNIGILQNDPDTALEAGLVRVFGVSKAVCDGNSVNIAPLDRLAPDAAGHLEKTTTDGDDYIAVALEACTADGQICSVFVMPFAEVSTG